jgi:hypothetical protein
MTKHESSVMEQNACKRSWGSSINLMRTSVISTTILLTGKQLTGSWLYLERNLRADFSGVMGKWDHDIDRFQ